MTAKGHIALASAMTLGSILVLRQHYPILLPSSTVGLATMIPSILFGSLFPDIDEDESYIGNKLKIFSIVFSMVLKHRTFTHYLIVPLLIIFSALYFVQYRSLTQLFLVSFAVGMIMHDIGDMLANGGIRGFFFPLFPNTRIALLPNFLRFSTFSMTEYAFIGFVLLPLNAYLLLSLFR